MFTKAPPVACALAALTLAAALGQQQESEMLRRVLQPPDQAKVNAMQTREYGAAAFQAPTFRPNEFRGTKSAEVRDFQTRSFLGIKNPWFGAPVFETGPSRFADRTNAAAGRAFSTGTFGTDAYAAAQREASTQQVVREPRAIKPEVIATETVDLDPFTRNLNRPLTHDDVRDLLNRQ